MNFVFICFCCLGIAVTKASVAISGLQYLLQLAQNAPSLLRIPCKAPVLPLIPPIFPMAIPKMLKHRKRYLKVDKSQNDVTDSLDADDESPLDIPQISSLDLDDSESVALKPKIYLSDIPIGIHVVPTPPYPRNEDKPIPLNGALKSHEEEELYRKQPAGIRVRSELKSDYGIGYEGLEEAQYKSSMGTVYIEARTQLPIELTGTVSGIQQDVDDEEFFQEKPLGEEQLPKEEKLFPKEEEGLMEEQLIGDERFPGDVDQLPGEKLPKEEQLPEKNERFPDEENELVEKERFHGEEKQLLGEQLPGEEQLTGEKENFPGEEKLIGDKERFPGDVEQLPGEGLLGEEQFPEKNEGFPEEEKLLSSEKETFQGEEKELLGEQPGIEQLLGEKERFPREEKLIGEKERFPRDVEQLPGERVPREEEQLPGKNERNPEEIEQSPSDKEGFHGEEKRLPEEQLPGEEQLPVEGEWLPKGEHISDGEEELSGDDMVLKNKLAENDTMLLGELIEHFGLTFMPNQKVHFSGQKVPTYKKAVGEMVTPPFVRYDDYGEDPSPKKKVRYSVTYFVMPRFPTVKTYKYH